MTSAPRSQILGWLRFAYVLLRCRCGLSWCVAPRGRYWAVVTGRDAMVELLWAQVGASAGTSCDTPSSPFVAAFLCNYVYRLRGTDDHYQNSRWID
eukprot:COSAG01_NODE_27040_length_696_cov_1.115578_1_plen_96_part_10